jgi:hypothetical protein
MIFMIYSLIDNQCLYYKYRIYKKYEFMFIYLNIITIFFYNIVVLSNQNIFSK